MIRFIELDCGFSVTIMEPRKHSAFYSYIFLSGASGLAGRENRAAPRTHRDPRSTCRAVAKFGQVSLSRDIQYVDACSIATLRGPAVCKPVVHLVPSGDGLAHKNLVSSSRGGVHMAAAAIDPGRLRRQWSRSIKLVTKVWLAAVNYYTPLSLCRIMTLVEGR
jgi:hypothetical protein